MSHLGGKLEEARKHYCELAEVMTSVVEAHRHLALDLEEKRVELEELPSRHVAMKKYQDGMDKRQSKLTDSMLRLDGRVKTRDKRIKELESMLATFEEEVICISPQLLVAKSVRNWAFSYGYGASLERLRVFLLVNPQTDLRTLNLDSFKLDRALSPLCPFLWEGHNA